jgi:hypothetical protein
MGEDNVVRKHPWKLRTDGSYFTHDEDTCLLAEKVGATFRVLVTRVVHEMQTEEIVYAGSAANADDAMTMAERVAERTFGQIAA